MFIKYASDSAKHFNVIVLDFQFYIYEKPCTHNESCYRNARNLKYLRIFEQKHSLEFQVSCMHINYLSICK